MLGTVLSNLLALCQSLFVVIQRYRNYEYSHFYFHILFLFIYLALPSLSCDIQDL